MDKHRVFLEAINYLCDLLLNTLSVRFNQISLNKTFEVLEKTSNIKLTLELQVLKDKLINQKNKIIDIKSEISVIQPQYQEAFGQIRRESLLTNNNRYATNEESNFTSNPPSMISVCCLLKCYSIWIYRTRRASIKS